MPEADLIVAHASSLLTCRNTRGEGPVRGSALEDLEVIPDASVAICGEHIAAVGSSRELLGRWSAPEVIDAAGRLVTPGLVDCHTHLLHGGSRHGEWEDRVLERPAPRLAAGIQQTVAATREASDAQLRQRALADLDQALLHGTTTLETKSGYGLDHRTELRLLHLAEELSDHPVEVVSTFLGAHVLPREFEDDRPGYIDLVCRLLDELPKSVEYCDLTCDPVGFTEAECRVIAGQTAAAGLRLRFHADQTGRFGGARLAAELGAASADHLESVDERDIAELAASGTIGVLLPGVTFHLLEMTPGVDPVAAPPRGSGMPNLARRLVDSGAALAVATDFNPGSCPTISMQMAMQLAARLYRLSYAEIWHLVTINAAWALDRGGTCGTLEVGKRADLAVWTVPEHGMAINRFGVNQVLEVVSRGRRVVVDGALAGRSESPTGGARAHPRA